ncbi:MAG: hypothetical protein IT306_27610 [Chloroflexi bacterium]|nr:hypothetical protein [Chloroflexota bacterium]
MVLNRVRALARLAGRRAGLALVLTLLATLALPARTGVAALVLPAVAGERGQQQTTQRGDQGDPAFLPELSAGFEGISKAGRWLTVRAVVANEGPPLDGELRLSMRTGGETAIYTQPIELAQRARKQAVFQVPGSIGLPDLRLTLRADETEIVTREVPLRTLSPNEFLVGVLSDDGLTPTGLASVRRGGSPVVVARLTPTDVPTDPLPFQSLDALVVRQASSDRLTAEQRAALQTWIEQGGQLIVAGGPGWRRSVEGLDELLPVFGLWTRPVKHLRSFARYAGVTPPDGDVLVTLGSPIEGARVILTQESIPLLVERWLGLGRVTFLGVDPSIEPFRSWPAAESVWQRVLVGGRPGLPILNEASSGLYPLRSALADMLNLGLPAAGWVIGFLVAYLVVAGPGQYFLLRRLDRREWGWIGFPSVALLAAGGLIGSAWWLRGPDVRLAAISTVRVAVDAKTAPVDTYVGLVAPIRGSYDLTFPDAPVPRPLGSSGVQTPTVIAAGLPGLMPTALPGLRMEGRSPQLLQWRTVTMAPTPILSELKTANGRLEGTVRNVGPDRLEDVFVLAAGEGVGLGDLGPNETRPVSISLPTSRAAGAWQNGPPPWSASAGGRGGSAVERRRALIAQLEQAGRGNDGETGGGAMLLAWVATTAPRLTLGEGAVEGTSRTLIEQALPVDYGREDVTIPPGLLARSVLDGAALTRGSGRSFLARGPIVFQFDLPPGLELARIDRLSVHLAVPSANRNAGPPRASLYRWADRTWIDVPLSGTGVANMPFGASFVDGGALRVRLEPPGNELTVEQLDLSLDGVRD